MYLAKQEDNIESAIKLYNLIVDGMKQRLGNVLHAHLGERKKYRSEVMMNQSTMSAIGKMKVIRDGIVQTVAHRQLIEKIKTFLVHFEQHLQVSIRQMVYRHLI